MSILHRVLHRLRPLFSRESAEEILRDEMRFHLEMEAADLRRAGSTVEESHREAHRRFGGATRFQEEVRDHWPLRRLLDVGRDVRYAIRSLARTPSFTFAATVALALGIGANAAVFSIVDSIAFRPMEVRAPSQIVSVTAFQGTARTDFSYPLFEDFRQAHAAFSDVSAFTEGPVSVDAEGEATAIWAVHTSDNYFAMLGVKAAAGRLYGNGELRSPVVVLGHALWKSRFNSDLGVIGRTIQINGRAFTVIGVASSQFAGTRLFSYTPGVWIPIGNHAATIPNSGQLLDSRDAASFTMLARLRDGISISKATALTNIVARDVANRFPASMRGFRTEVLSNRIPINPILLPTAQLQVIGGCALLGIFLVLLIACANVANLLLARLTARQREVAVRLSLGASRGRLMQQFLTESLVLALAGALTAIPVALLAMRVLQGITPRLDFATELRPNADLRVFAFAAFATILAALAFGVFPALQSSKQGLMKGLRGSGDGPHFNSRLRETLVAAQVGLSVLILIATALLARSLRAAHDVNPGFTVADAFVVTLDPQMSPSYDVARTRAAYQRIMRDLTAIPGVVSASRATTIPLDGNFATRRVFVPGQSMVIEDATSVDYNVVAPDYFKTIDTPLLTGREFVVSDTAMAIDPVIVNEVLAKSLWPGESAIGKRIRVGSPAAVDAEVIGVARVSKYRFLGDGLLPAVWRSLDRSARSRTTIVVRTSIDARVMLPAMRRVIQGVDPSLGLIGLTTLKDHVSLAYSAAESTALGATSFAVVALLLAMSGIFGVVAYTVSQRRPELGVRIALGANAQQIVQSVMARSLRMTAIGAAVATAVVVAIPAKIDGVLYGVSHRDPLLIGGTLSVFLIVAAIAAFIPARRAAQLNPVQILRLE